MQQKNITDFQKGRNFSSYKDSRHRQLYLETVLTQRKTYFMTFVSSCSATFSNAKRKLGIKYVTTANQALQTTGTIIKYKLPGRSKIDTLSIHNDNNSMGQLVALLVIFVGITLYYYCQKNRIKIPEST
jgi:hypothetical protein